MSAAMSVNNGLHHAASLGTIDASVKSTRPTQIERNYDSEDENSGRRKIKHISSTEFYAKPSQYSKFDIREQYCLTDRQLNTIERSRRDRFFGCLSRRATPQSLLGGCVGRRVPSDENLAVYAPFYKYPRYPHPYLQSDAAVNRIDLETSYFRRQPASILSTSKMVEGAADSRMGWPNSQQSYYGIRSNNSEDLNYFNKSSSYDTPPIVGVPGPSPRTKHVSFARSHTLTSFDDFNVGFRTSQHIKAARSQERLLGGKKPIAAYNPCYETLPAYVPQMPLIGSNSALHMISQPAALPRGMQQHGHSHQGQHHRHLGHIHQRSLTVCGQEKPVQTQQPTATILASRTLEDEMSTMNAIPLITCTTTNAPAPLSPEVIVVEKKFRNAMKTQATQTDVRKHDFEHRLELSPRTIHRVKVVSQGAQTNGTQNGKFLAQSLLEIPTELTIKSILDVQDHEMVFRTQSEIPRRQTLELNFPYYQPPPPPLEYQNNTTKGQPSLSQKDDIFTYESNSLPRRTCGYRIDTDYHSLPRRDFQNLQDIRKHITECSELLGTVSTDIISDLLPPPQEYCHDDEDSLEITRTYPKENKDYNRRKSFVATADSNKSSPFRRDDVRRQSMPVYVQREKLLYINSTSPQTFFRKSFRDNMLNEKEIIIDFKPSKSLHKTHFNVIKHQPKCDEFEKMPTVKLSKDLSTLIAKPLDQGEDPDYPVYENIIDPIDKISHVREAESSDQEGREEQIVIKSAPASPHKDEPLICHPSTYPSSDSLANDTTRDHSDGNWNESQVTVLTAEQRSEASFNSHNLLTPSTRRKHLLLQHQQRSSIDTDALDLEEQFNDQSPTYSQASLSLKTKSPVVVPKESNIAFSVPVLPKLISPSMEITTTFEQVTTVHRPTKIAATSPREYRRNMNSSPIQLEQRRSSEISLSYLMTFGESQKLPSGGNADVSECSTNTNTEDYATCTDTSRRTAGIRPSFATTTTTTSSSSTTQVPVSTQSSQMDHTHAESSFESASSLHSSKCDAINEDLTLELSAEIKTKPESNSNLISFNNENVKVSPSHSVISTSSGSYNVMGEGRVADFDKQQTQDEMEEVPQRETIQSKMESISDDERSEVRYSSSGYYESPQDDGYSIKWKTKRYRSEEERRRRKNIMKFNIEKENMRALMSPINREYIKGSPEKPKLSILVDATSPVKLKRFRPKIRRQLRRLSRDDISSKSTKSIENLSPTRRQSEALIEAITLHVPSPEKSEETKIQNRVDSLSPYHLKALSETYQLKTKSIESLNRSVSPGSDSVFYSEADANNVEQNSALNSHDSKEVEELSVVCDSVESLPYIDNEPDIVKPPSDFADSPIISKTTQRLYKKMDKRFRSEERYQGDRGRHYKNRKDNIRAKSEERNQEMIKKTSSILRSTGSSPCILPEFNVDVKQQTIYIGHYDCSRYTRLTDSDIWAQLDHQSLEKNRDRRNSTDSERSFYSKYQVTLHRLVQRRCTLEMYRRQKSDIFKLIISNSSPESLRRKLEEVLKLMLLMWARESHVLAKLTQGKYGVDKTVVVKSDSGEFGFRIHGSKPVVVAAIEPETPAESSGLEVGDIVISVNGIQVLDKHHTEVVKIAHDGCEKLELEVARTLGVLMNEQQEPPIQVIYSGYLWRQSGQAKGSPNIKKWVQRWFVLRSDNCLYYYKTEEDTQPVGAMIMVKHQVDICSPKVGRPHAFKVDCGEGIPLYMAADNEGLANSWLMVLKKATEQENSWLDKSSRNLYKTPSSISRPDCSGYLMKLGSKWCGWSKRYCVLKDACLYFFQDINAKTALGMVCLHGYKVASISTSALGKRNSFEIVPPESKLRHYYFHTESDMEKKRWISALEYSIDRWIKSG